MSEEDEIIEAPEAPPEAQAENERKPELFWFSGNDRSGVMG
jgi:hypothetical protein